MAYPGLETLHKLRLAVAPIADRVAETQLSQLGYVMVPGWTATALRSAGSASKSSRLLAPGSPTRSAKFARLWTMLTGRRVMGLSTSTNAARVL